MKIGIVVHRRIGGLEIVSQYFFKSIPVHRRIDGLEIKETAVTRKHLVHRRIGGLEIFLRLLGHLALRSPPHRRLIKYC